MRELYQYYLLNVRDTHITEGDGSKHYDAARLEPISKDIDSVLESIGSLELTETQREYITKSFNRLKSLTDSLYHLEVLKRRSSADLKQDFEGIVEQCCEVGGVASNLPSQSFRSVWDNPCKEQKSNLIKSLCYEPDHSTEVSMVESMSKFLDMCNVCPYKSHLV